MTTEPSAAATTCPKCGEPHAGESNFCENCGAPLTSAAAAAPVPGDPANPGAPDAPGVPAGATVPTGSPETEPAPLDLGSGPISAPTNLTATVEHPPPAGRACASCGGPVGADGYCQSCGMKAQSPRDHFREQPAPWVAGVCDRGIRHHRNEDAMALLASPDPTAPDRRAVLVVLDGVSNTDDSQVGSLAGAKAALAHLRTPLPQGMGTPASRTAAATQVMAAACQAAFEEVVKAAPEGAANPASATYVVAILEGTTLTYGNVGDSRSYWLPDGGPGEQLSTDDSAAQQQMAAGVPREVAETSPQAHAITRWLGRDSDDHVPRVAQRELTEPGWLLVCSDGLWNYASEPSALAAQVAAAATTDPAALALKLVDFANACGGQDNITATLARVDPVGTPPPVGSGHNASSPDAPADPQADPLPASPPIAAPDAPKDSDG